MARLGCTCGNVLSNTCDYETDVYYIYPKEEILTAIGKNPQVLYWDFYVDREPEVDYWYCPHCKRMMECSLGAYGSVLRKFKPIRLTDENKTIDTSTWREFYSFSDNELLALTDKNYEQGYKMTLQDFYEKYPRKYYYRISPDETVIFAYESATGHIAFAYGKEDWMLIEHESK